MLIEEYGHDIDSIDSRNGAGGSNVSNESNESETSAAESDDSQPLRIQMVDLFVVKYSIDQEDIDRQNKHKKQGKKASNSHAELHAHTDGGTVSFNALLSRPITSSSSGGDFTGGGTFFTTPNATGLPILEIGATGIAATADGKGVQMSATRNKHNTSSTVRLNIRQGSVLMHNAAVPHGGSPVTFGTRYLLVGQTQMMGGWRWHYENCCFMWGMWARNLHFKLGIGNKGKGNAKGSSAVGTHSGDRDADGDGGGRCLHCEDDAQQAQLREHQAKVAADTQLAGSEREETPAQDGGAVVMDEL